MTRDQLAMIVHATINRMEDFDPVGEELLHVQPWAALDDRQKEYCARIGEAVFGAIELDRMGMDESILDHIRRYAYLSSDDRRTDQEEAELNSIRVTLKELGMEPGWKPVPRKAPNPPPA